jgi:hypothetical protein
VSETKVPSAVEVEKELEAATAKYDRIVKGLRDGTSVAGPEQRRQAKERVEYLTDLLAGARAREERESEAKRHAASSDLVARARKGAAETSTAVLDAHEEAVKAVRLLIEATETHGRKLSAWRAEEQQMRPRDVADGEAPAYLRRVQGLIGDGLSDPSSVDVVRAALEVAFQDASFTRERDRFWVRDRVATPPTAPIVRSLRATAAYDAR